MTKNFSTWAILIQFLILFLLHKESECSSRQAKLYEFQTKLQQKTSLSASFAAAPVANSPKGNGRVFYPIGYGTDPTGAQDSTAAVLAAVSDAVKKLQNGLNLLPGIADLGGVVIDLQGGNYIISSPIRFPAGVGNIVVQGGTLRASKTFPGDRHLIELWAAGSQKPTDTNLPDRKDLNSGMKYEDITFRDILFDSSYRGGGLLVQDSARTRVISCFFFHFTTEGILVVRGHETFITGCFIGQHPTVGGDPAEKTYTGTGIDLASNDNAITDVVIFSASIGILLRGQANMITGVHCYNKATYFGGVGILVKAGANRIVDSYLDYNSIVIEDPDRIHVSNGFFLGDGNIVLKAIQGRISGLNIVNNIFSGGPGNKVPSVALDGAFKSIDRVVIENNVVDGMALRSTVGKLTVAGNGTKWVADFSPILLFPNKINHVQYSFYTRGGIGNGFPAHAVTNVSNNLVVIESQQAANAVVSVSVDQYNMVGEGNFVV